MATILVVEDERVVARDIQETLVHLGYDVMGAAASGEECLRRARLEPPNLVLMDVRIEGSMDGIQTATCLKSELDVPVIYMTAYADDETLARASRTEAHGYIVKPFRAREVKSAIEIALFKHQAEMATRAEGTLAATQDRLDSLRVLAAGVSHEINNPLTSVMANASLGMRELGRWEDSPGSNRNGAAGSERASRIKKLAHLISEIEEGADRIRRVVADVREFTYHDPGVQRGDVRAALGWALRVTGPVIRARAHLELELEPTPPVGADSMRLSQVFVNLLMNAAQSIEGEDPENQRVTVSTGVAGDGSVLVAVQDTGTGMSSDVVRRVFDPFFTTKSPGDGKGLGLSVCHGIVASMGGELTVESSPGEGSTFLVRLPPAREKERPSVRVCPDVRQG